MTEMNDKFVAGSIVALATPFDEDGTRIDTTALNGLLKWHVDAGSGGIVVAGTTGESATLDQDERDLLVESTLGFAAEDLLVIAGTGAPSTAAAVAQSRRAADQGAAAVLVVTPHYNRPPQRGLDVHFRTVADACPVPVILYNVPGRTAIDLEPDTVEGLAEHPNIVGIKEAIADMDRIRRYADAGLTVLSGDDPSALEAMKNGASGVISVASNIAPSSMARMCHLAAIGDFGAAESLARELEALFQFLTLESNPIPVKWLLSSAGRIGPSIRLPLVPLDERHHDAGRSLLQSLSDE